METIYAIVKRNNESYYIECQPTDKVLKLKQELIHHFYSEEIEMMRLYLEKYRMKRDPEHPEKDPVKETYWVVSYRFFLFKLIQLLEDSTSIHHSDITNFCSIWFCKRKGAEGDWEIVYEVNGTSKEELHRILNPIKD